MNPYNRNLLDEIRRFFRQGSALAILILVNIAFWLLAQAVHVVYFLYNQPDTAAADNFLSQLFAVPAYIPFLASRPWTIVSYMFLHFGFWHILFNMLWLFWFGKIFLEYLTSRQLVITYILGGVAGAAVYILAFNIFPVFHGILEKSVALGASASVMAIVMAISFYAPSYTINLLFIGRVKILYLALVLFLFDFFAIPGGNSGGHLAHIGGAFWGFLYALSIRKGLPGRFGTADTFFRKFRSFFTSAGKNRSAPGAFGGRPVSDDDYNRDKARKQKRIDEILEKISKGGYDSLTREEKDLLFRSSGKEN
jgi:membrane associated rhomboid family serine protease